MIAKRTVTPLLLAVLALLAAAPALGQPAPGTFRFITQDMPDGSTNTEYAATLLTANATGAVTFSSDPVAPAPGLSLDPQTGLISGIPTEVDGSGFHVTFYADDGTTVIEFDTKIKVSSAGGGGNSGVNFATATLAEGRVGAAYLDTLVVQNAVGPVVFAATDLPPGLALDGATGAIAGTPQTAGTFYVTVSATDRGENDNKIFTILPLLVRPAGSDFRFVTTLLNNGEAGSSFSDTWTTAGGVGTVRYGATGLPPGLSVDADTGVVSGVPTQAGLFLVRQSATDDQGTITTNRSMMVVPSSTSGFHWEFSGLPAALVGVDYTRQPPILVTSKNGTTVTYSAIGVPAGLSYDALTGELTGMAEEVGIYPVQFRAEDTTSAETIVLSTDFIVLPPYGGDAGTLPSNLWVMKETLKPRDPEEGSWKATYLYNADRRTGRAFDPATDTFQIGIGSRLITAPPGSMATSRGRFVYESEDDVLPKVKVVIDPDRQRIQVKSKKDTLTESVPGVLRNTCVLGGKGFRVETFLDDDGKYASTAGCQRAAFVITKATLEVKGPGRDEISLGWLLADPALVYESGVTELRLQLDVGGTTLLDKTFTTLVTGKADVGDERTTYKLKKTEDDEAATDALSKFKFKSSKGKGKLVVEAADLSALAAGENHVFVQLTVGPRTYFTTITLFEDDAGEFTNRMK
jgi:hypothetical protein